MSVCSATYIKTCMNKKELNLIHIIHCPIVMIHHSLLHCINTATWPLCHWVNPLSALEVLTGCIPHAGPIHSHEIEPFRLPDSSQQIPTWSNCIMIIDLSVSIYSCWNHCPDIELPYLGCQLLSPCPHDPLLELTSSRPMTPAARTLWGWRSWGKNIPCMG